MQKLPSAMRLEKSLYFEQFGSSVWLYSDCRKFFGRFTRTIPMLAASATITVDNAHLWYGKGESQTHALRGLSMSCLPGEVLLVRGPSGSGKTTLLQIMGR